MTYDSPEFWIALVQIIGIDIVLSGDNAVVIALAARSLPPDQQRRAVIWGSGAAVLMRIAMTVVAVELLRLPYLKLVGAALLLWIAVQLLMPEEEGHGKGTGSSSLAGAIKTILLADVVMSLDNVIAIAGAAKGSTVLLIIGLAVSIPLVVFASRLLLTLMDRFPSIVTIGAALLGWVAGEMAVTDPIVKPWVAANAPFLHWWVSLAAAIGVVLFGKWLAARHAARRAVPVPVPVPAAASAPGLVQRVLLAVDGSPGAELAVRHFISLRQQLRQPPVEVHLVNVERPVSGDVARFVPGQALDDYHRERSEKALAPARALLDAAGIRGPREHRDVGAPGPTIARVAQEAGCDLIMMGTRGFGSHTGAMLGSVAQATIEHASVPVLVVK